MKDLEELARKNAEVIKTIKIVGIIVGVIVVASIVVALIVVAATSSDKVKLSV